MSIERKLLELADKRERAMAGGGEKRIAKQHQQGKLTARERIDMLMTNGAIGLMLVIIALAILYFYAPEARQKFKHILPGTVTASLLWLAALIPSCASFGGLEWPLFFARPILHGAASSPPAQADALVGAAGSD